MKSKHLFKPFFLAVTATILIFSSCQKEDQEDVSNSDEVESSQAILVAEASTSSEAIFIVNTAPRGANRDSITVKDLPASITTYLAANYDPYTLKKTFKVSVKGTLDSYIVVISYNGKPVGLKFDANGQFVRVFEQRERGCLRGKGWKEGGHFDGRDGRHRDTIALTSLSTAIKAYFQLTLPKDTLLHAFKGKDNTTIVISANNELYATAFNGSDLFVRRVQIILNKGMKKAVAQAALPMKALTYLASTYPGYIFKRAYSISVGGTVQAYAVLIDANDTGHALHFDADGNFVNNLVVK